MSDTPKTTALYQSVCRFTNEEQAVEALADLRDLAKELERENAALREALHDIMTESDEQVIWRMARAALEKKAQP